MLHSYSLKKRALEIGFDIAGIAPLEVWADLDFARGWVEQGYGGEMRYLENPRRHDPRRVLASAQSVVCVGLIYNAPFPYSTEVGKVPRPQKAQTRSGQTPEDGTPRAWIARYAWGQDYHTLMRAKLEELRKSIEDLAPCAETRLFVDTGPVVERAFARYSGIGWTGKNTCLINASSGSWFFLGVILTSLPLEPDLPAPDRCGSCTRCLDACPTGALTESYVMDASRCIAYFNIELKGSIPEPYRPQIGANLFGCDICQDVCPWNRNAGRPGAGSGQYNAESPAKGYGRSGAVTTALPEFQPMEIEITSANPGENTGSPAAKAFSLFNPPLDALVQLGEQDFRRTFSHSPVKRPKYRGWLRNLCVVMGNSGDRRFVPKLEELSHHDDPIIREHAVWALRHLEGTLDKCAQAQDVTADGCS